MQKTLAMIKPDCLSKGLSGKVISMIEDNGFRINAMKMISISEDDAKRFYSEHEGKEFFLPLVEFMSSNPSVILVLSRDNAIMKWREIIGKTNPLEAAPGTVRNLFASDGRHNIVHGSDSERSSAREIEFFFKKEDIYEWLPREYKK